jgi:hypothetical protein
MQCCQRRALVKSDPQLQTYVVIGCDQNLKRYQGRRKSALLCKAGAEAEAVEAARACETETEHRVLVSVRVGT